VRNFESGKLKVNDLDGNPIEIAAVVVWRVVDTAEAVFEVDDYENYVHVQSESALRNLATQLPYDTHTTTSCPLSCGTPTRSPTT
jgi:regulator of protease activity HflC (stomatin/prohibitin superfamily)